MALIEVDPQELLGTASRIEGAIPAGQDFGSGGSLGVAAAAAGNGDVTGAIRSFLDDWNYGLSLINKDALHLADLLRRAGGAYVRAEEAISKAEQ